MFTPAEDIKDAQIIISDFGESFIESDTSRTELHTPVLLLPPEHIFKEPLTQAVDVWTLGCTLHEILGDGTLFEGFVPDEDHVVAEMISTLGHIPDRWWEKWARRSDFFLEDKEWKQDTERAHAPYFRPLAERLTLMRGGDPKTCEFTAAELKTLEELLREMLAYEPGDRISAGQAVGSEWMRQWGHPAMLDVGVETGAGDDN